MMKSKVGAALLFGGLCSCVTDPYHNKVIDDKDDPLTIQAWALSAEVDLDIQCRPYFIGGSWTDAGTLTSASSPVTLYGDELYAISGSVSIPDECWFGWHNQFTTELRFLQDGYYYQVYDSDGLSCLGGNLAADGPVDAGWNCRLTRDDGSTVNSIYVHAEE